MDEHADPPADEMVLVVGFEDGTEIRTTVGPPGNGERVAVGTAAHRCSVWRMFASKSKKGGSDVFVTAAALGTASKFSLHESGVWRNAWHSEEHARKYGFTGTPEHGSDPRVLDRWQRPEGVIGWTRGVTVWVPEGHLAPSSDPEDPKRPVTWLPEPGQGEMVGLHFAMVRPDQGELNMPGHVPVCGFRLPNGDAAVVVYTRSPVDERVLREHERNAAEAASATLGPPPYKESLRVGLFGHDAVDGHRFVWVLSLSACFGNRDAHPE